MKNGKVVELNVQVDHVHLVVRMQPSLSISKYKGFVDSDKVVQQISVSKKAEVMGQLVLAAWLFC